MNFDQLIVKLFYKKDQNEVYNSFDKLFKKQDYWSFSKSPYERRRYAALLKYVDSVPHDSILEIGSAEGHLTRDLLKLSKNVTAIDVSKVAIERSKKIAPGAKYFVGTFEDFPLPDKPYDIVMCSEVLCYVKDKGPFIAKMKHSAKYLVMSNYFVYSLLAEPYFSPFKLRRRRIITGFNEKWSKFTSVTLWKLP